MPFSFPVYRVRCQSDYAVRGSVIDRLTNKPIRIPKASDIRFEIGIFAGLNGQAPSAASQVADSTGWQSLTLTLQSSSGRNVVSITTGTFTTPTYSTWNDDTAQHCTISISDAESNIHPGKYQFCLTIQSSTFGPFPAGTAEIEVYDPFNLNSSDPADANPGAPISRDAADLRYEPLGGGASTSGKNLFVDSVYGSNTTGTRERFDKPFLALSAAKTAAQSGDTIYVRPGSYSTTASLAKDGVNWHFEPGTAVTMTGNSTTAIWDDGNTAMNFNVTGEADFIRTNNSGSTDVYGIRLQHASSNFNIQCRDITVTGPQHYVIAALRQDDGRIVLRARVIDSRAISGAISGYGLYWLNGSGEVHAAKITSDYVTVWSSVDSTPTGDFHVFSAEILNAILSSGLNATAACWVHFDILSGAAGDGSAFTANSLGFNTGNKIYLTGQKIFGFIHSTDFAGLLYVEIQKHQAVTNGTEDDFQSFFSWGLGSSAIGTCFYRADHWDHSTHTGQIMQIDSGIVEMTVGRFVGTSSSKGIMLKGGELRFKKGRLDLSANASAGADAITLKGSGITLTSEARLIVNGARKSIANGNAGTYTVDCWGGLTNADVDSGITANGLVVDSTVT